MPIPLSSFGLLSAIVSGLTASFKSIKNSQLSPPLMESPECPVCLQNYDGACTVPRVLACGHTACETCLLSLPQRYPSTIRCPACTQLVKYPPQGPSGLPKNIDLLRLSDQNPIPNPPKPHNQSTNHDHQLVPQFWSDEFYASWKTWILPQDCFLVDHGDDHGVCSVLRGRSTSSFMTNRGCVGEAQMVSHVRVVSLPSVNGSVLNYSYTVQVLKCLFDMKEEERIELGLILRASLKLRGVSKVYGLWGDLEDGFLYLVSERHCGSLLQKMGDFRNGLIGGNGDYKGGLANFALIGMEMCEAITALHLEGLVLGCMGLSCFSIDEFGHVRIDLAEVLLLGRKVYRAAADRRIGDRVMGALLANLFTNELLVSPELMFELLQGEGIGLERSGYDYKVQNGSDVWPLGFMLIRLLVGEQFHEKLVDYMGDIFVKSNNECNSYCLGDNTVWVEKISSLLETRFGGDFLSLQQILCKCLDFEPRSRSLVNDVWECIRELIIKPQFDILFRFDRTVNVMDKSHCLALGQLCQLPEEISETQKQEKNEDGGAADLDQVLEERVDKNIVDGISQRTVKFKEMQGHLDCVTGLALGGGFLFSSSFDKTIQVWSLQDFSHVHTFRGHEHKVMAIVYIDEELPLCISGDSGGGIFVWSISIPLGEEPLQKWHEEKDWRYSGIHTLAVPGNKYLYTGSGDKSIKAWSLLDHTLTCTMNGHKSVVSALAACNGVLYSGSYDGTIRLWCLSDHSPLTVLNEDTPGNITSVLSLKVDGNMIVAAHENGSVKFWRNDVFVKSEQMHNGATFAVALEGKWLFTAGWDKTINVQELSVDDFQMDVRQIGSIPCSSVITSLVYWQGKLFAGCADRIIKVYYCGR